MRTLLKKLIRMSGFELSRIAPDYRNDYAHAFADTRDASLGEDEREFRRIKNLLSYTKSSGSPYNAEGFESAYHTTEILGRTLKGQRDPARRFASVPFDFTKKCVLDLGCNQGGMLFALGDKLEAGVGIDYDYRMINAANRMKITRGMPNLSFYVSDLERDPLAVIDQYVTRDIDVVFLLSVCMWIANWREVIAYSRQRAPHLLFEANGSADEQSSQVAELRRHYRTIDLLQDGSPDDPLQKGRQLYFCTA